MLAEHLGCPRNMLLHWNEDIEEWTAYLSLKRKYKEKEGDGTNHAEAMNRLRNKAR